LFRKLRFDFISSDCTSYVNIVTFRWLLPPDVSKDGNQFSDFVPDYRHIVELNGHILASDCV